MSHPDLPAIEAPLGRPSTPCGGRAQSALDCRPPGAVLRVGRGGLNDQINPDFVVISRSMGPTIEVKKGMCWWCREREADSSEHKFKRTDLIREHGRGELRGERTIVMYGEGEREMRSTKNDALKFSSSLCAQCNNARSQPFDRAYDRFIELLFEREDEVIADRHLDLSTAFGPDWTEFGEDVLRYFVKHICCRLAETLTVNEEIAVPADAISFLDGGEAPPNLSCEMWIEPTWLRFWEAGAEDPLWIRPMGMEPVHAGPNTRLGSRWTYGWLVIGWEFWGEEESVHPFAEQLLPLPIMATRRVNLEFALMPTTANRESDGIDQNWLNKIAGGAIAPDGALDGSPAAEKFIGGALDFEAATRERAPDHRELLVHGPRSAVEIEVRRVGLLCGIARAVWARCSIDIDAIHSVQLTEHLLNPEAIEAALLRMPDYPPEEGWLTVCNGFAAMASYKMIEAQAHGVGTSEGDEALLLAASLAGSCAAAAGAASGDWRAAWDSVHAATAVIAHIGTGSESLMEA